MGCPRSGTTYLMSILNALPNAECISGTLLPVTIPHVVNHVESKEIYDALAVGFERALDAYLHSERYLSRAAVVQKWMAARTGVRDLVRSLHEQRPFPRWMIYKEPFLSLAPNFVLDAFPESKLLYIYRDGRDVANSLVKTYDVLTDEKLKDLSAAEMRLGRPLDDRFVPWWVEEGADQRFMESTPYVRAIWMWKYMVRQCHDALSDHAVDRGGRVLMLRYEDLARDPQGQGQRLMNHLGAEGTSSLLRRLGAARSSSIGKHTRRSADEIHAAEVVAGDELRLLGYL